MTTTTMSKSSPEFKAEVERIKRQILADEQRDVRRQRREQVRHQSFQVATAGAKGLLLVCGAGAAGLAVALVYCIVA